VLVLQAWMLVLTCLDVWVSLCGLMTFTSHRKSRRANMVEDTPGKAVRDCCAWVAYDLP
jgi:hypothetical protein